MSDLRITATGSPDTWRIEPLTDAARDLWPDRGERWYVDSPRLRRVVADAHAANLTIEGLD